jgi:hypothetical protein
MKPIQMPVILNRVSTRADGSLSLNFETQEMDAESTTVLIKLCRIELVALLTPKGVPLEAPIEVKSEAQSKTPSQRLRAVVFALFAFEKEQGKIAKDELFEFYYAKKMEKVIEWVKSKLPEQ